jgi:hypothetical protein
MGIYSSDFAIARGDFGVYNNDISYHLDGRVKPDHDK